MTFIPYPDKIQVRPLDANADSPIVRDGNDFQEAGTVVAVGAAATWFKVGDIVYFLSYGSWKTKVGEEEIWVVPATDEYILGKVEANEELEV